LVGARGVGKARNDLVLRKARLASFETKNEIVGALRWLRKLASVSE
jgi:hypothetical protein